MLKYAACWKKEVCQARSSIHYLSLKTFVRCQVPGVSRTKLVTTLFAKTVPPADASFQMTTCGRLNTFTTQVTSVLVSKVTRASLP